MNQRAVVLVLAIVSASCSGICLESCRAGAALPTGGGEVGIVGSPAVLFAMYGTEQTRAGHEQVALFNALILKPEGTGPGYSGSSFSWECVRASETFKWSQEPESPRLQLNYDGGRRVLMIRGQEWSTVAANTFVITLDDRWEPSVLALPLLIRSPAGAETLGRIQRAVPADKRVGTLSVAVP